MSCGNPAIEVDALMPRRKRYDKSKKCVRCKEAAGSIAIRYAVYCKACFFPLVIHKFRRGLEPSVNPKSDGPRRTALKPDGNLLVGFSGGLGSSVLLDLVHRCYVNMDEATMPSDGGKQHPRHEKVWSKVTVCYVEICDAFPGMCDRTADVERFVCQYEGLNFKALRLQHAFDSTWWKEIHRLDEASGSLHADLSSEELKLAVAAFPSSTSTPLLRLQTYLASLPTATAVPATIQTLVRLLLLHTAVHTESSHLVLGTSLTNLAISLISGISQGRGYNVKEETHEEWLPDTKDTDQDGVRGTNGQMAADKQKMHCVRVVRPLRDVGRKECALWAWWRDVSVVGKVWWPWSSSKQDIQSLTSEFITRLEKDYPSTVSTIVRTCTKVEPKGHSSGLCVLCARPIQADILGWKSRIAVRSRDRLPPAMTEPASSHPLLTPCLCYACHTTLTSRSSRPAPSLGLMSVEHCAVPLPVWVRPEGLCSRMSTEQMEASVHNFLLENDTL